jgi:hypothetical protein
MLVRLPFLSALRTQGKVFHHRVAISRKTKRPNLAISRYKKVKSSKMKKAKMAKFKVRIS